MSCLIEFLMSDYQDKSFRKIERSFPANILTSIDCICL